jgi:hypothetical protein
MTTSTQQVNPAQRPGFYELVTRCQLFEISKRIGKAVITFFVSTIVGICESISWVCKSIYACITCKCCCKGEETDPLNSTATRVDETTKTVPIRPSGRDPITTNTTSTSILDLTDVDVLSPENIANGTVEIENLVAIRDSCPYGSVAWRAYSNAIELRAQMESTTTPLRQATTTNTTSLPGPTTRNVPPRPNRNTQQAIPFTPSIVLMDNDVEGNKKILLDRIATFKASLETTLKDLKLQPKKALQKLAELESGSQKGILDRAPPGVLDRLKATPVRINMIINPNRTQIWPQGVAAADKLAELEKAPEKAILRLAQIQTLEHFFQVREEILDFDFDIALQKYDKNHSTLALREWYNYVYPNQNLGNPKMSKYYTALNNYRKGNMREDRGGGRAGNAQADLVAEYLSNIHAIFSTRKAVIEKEPDKEEALKTCIQSFIDTIIDANEDCVDQMISQLEKQLLNLIADEVPDNLKTPLDTFKFKAGIALTEYRTALISVFTQKLNPDESHMADLERAVKQKVAEDLNLKGKIFLAGAKYHHIVNDVNRKSERVKSAVLTEHNPLVYLLDHFRDDKHDARAVKSLRGDILQMISTYCDLPLVGILEKENNDPLVEALSAGDMDSHGNRTDYLTALTFEGILASLEVGGIIVANHPS